MQELLAVALQKPQKNAISFASISTAIKAKNSEEKIIFAVRKKKCNKNQKINSKNTEKIVGAKFVHLLKKTNKHSSANNFNLPAKIKSS